MLTIKYFARLREQLGSSEQIAFERGLTLGGLRDSENSVFSAAGWFGDSIAGITIPTALAGWFRQAGYSDVRNHAVVTHGLVCRSLAARHLRLADGHIAPERWENTAVTIVEAAEPWRVHLLNCVAHLDGDASVRDGAAV